MGADNVRLDERTRFAKIELMDGSEVGGLFWLTRGYGDLQGPLGPVLTNGTQFWPLSAVKSFSL